MLQIAGYSLILKLEFYIIENRFISILISKISKWNSGSYTLLNDQDGDDLGEGGALDLWLFISADHWQLSHGGQVSYIARGEDEEVFNKM